MGSHELVRHYVVEVLGEKEERTELREVVNALWQHVREARKDIALAAETLLSSAEMLDAKEAREWTQKNSHPRIIHDSRSKSGGRGRSRPLFQI